MPGWVAVAPTATPRPTARATATRVAAVPTPRAVETRASAAAPGTLSVTARPWVQVWVDGKMIAKETPLPGGGVEIPAGKHVLRVVNPTLQFDESRNFTMPAGGQAGFAVDVKAKSIIAR